MIAARGEGNLRMDTDFTAVPDWFPAQNADAGIAVADLDGNGLPDTVLFMVDSSAEANAGWFRVGRGTDDEGTVGQWSDWRAVPDWFPWQNQGAGIAVTDVNGDGTADLVVLMVDAPDGPNAGWYRVGWGLDADGGVTGWSGWSAVPDWFPGQNAGVDIAVADVDGDGTADLVVLMVDAPDGPNAGYYRSGPLGPGGVVTAWRDWVAIPDWRFWENQGAGVAVADLDGDGHLELLVLAVDDPAGPNGGYYSVGWRLDGRGRPVDGWGPWEPVPDWRFWQNAGAAATVAPLGARGMPHLVVLAVDDPEGPNGGWYRLLDPMTDREMAPQMGVWRILEETSQIIAVHAALLHTGGVIFFAGSGNDPDRHTAQQYGTVVWDYPQPQFTRPPTPADMFCVGHAFLPDGRLLAAGGTEQYDPFLGLTAAVVFDPATGAWENVPDMAGGRWYPALLPLADGRVLAVSGLDGTGQLNVVPEIYTEPAGWQALPPSPHFPMYAHLFLLADGRIFYSGGQYGDNMGVRASIWDAGTNAAVEVPGLPGPGERNQSASVLLPPAQDQRVMIIGGGPYDMHNQAGSTASTAIADLRAAAPAYTPAAPLGMARMHLCATLLPDRTVLVNGGAMMEESVADAAFAAEIYHPDAAGAPGGGGATTGRWEMAASSRVPRLYHSVALLMPDGKVITAGSNPQRKTEELRIEVFWPPYLFAGPRPTAAPGATEVGYGDTLAVAVPEPGAVASACLIRPGATTHSSDAEQRLVDLPLVPTGGAGITVRLPAVPALAPPGWYLLFVTDTAGRPSDGAWVHLRQ